MATHQRHSYMETISGIFTNQKWGVREGKALNIGSKVAVLEISKQTNTMQPQGIPCQSHGHPSSQSKVNAGWHYSILTLLKFI